MTTSFLQRLATRQRFGVKPGLENMRLLVAALGNPHHGLRFIHVAGTNGKGAICAMLEKVLGDAGISVGRYTSPHLVSLNERFHIDGAPIDDSILDAAAEKVFAALEHLEKTRHIHITFFEALTAVAFCAYAQLKPRFVICEVGLGGRLDATNVLRDADVALSVITSIGLDHCDWLGHTLTEIAREKGGIMRPHVPLFTGALADEARAEIRFLAHAKTTPLNSLLAPPGTASETFMAHNERLARKIAAFLHKAEGLSRLTPKKVQASIAHTFWPGRFQHLIYEGIPLIIDGAHNPPACSALVNALAHERQNENPARPIAFICGFCGDKDVAANAQHLATISTRCWTVKTTNPRALSAEAAAQIMAANGFKKVIPADALVKALAQAKSWAKRRQGKIVLCGSLFLAGEALATLGAINAPTIPHPNESFVVISKPHER